MAPEQFTPGHRPTNKVDIWGFASTLLHMLTGAPPWAHDTLLQICTAVGVAQQAPPLPQGLPQQLEALLRGCFEPDPARRPTAGAVLKALQAMGPVLERPQLMRATSSLARNSQLLAAARGVLVGLQQDCCQLVQQLQEAGATADGGGSSNCGVGRLHAVAEEEEVEAQQQAGGGHGQGHGKQQHGQPTGDRKGDQRASLDQYLAQIGLLPLISQESSLGAPSAPPLPRGSSSSSSSSITGSSMAAAAAAAAAGACGPAGGFAVPSGIGHGHYGGSSSHDSIRPSSSLSNRQPGKLPRVLWSEEEAVREEHEAQQQRRQQQQVQQQGLAASMGLAPPKRQPQHARSVSEQVVGSSGCASHRQEQMPGSMQQQQLQQQQRDCKMLGSAADAGSLNQQQQQQQQQQQHHRSVSDGFEVWGARSYGGSSSGSNTTSGSRLQAQGQLPTHFESPAHSTTSSSCAEAAEQLGSGCKQQQQQQQGGQVRWSRWL
ncbi:hypothetical protein COO60DRAFT_434274 [Scenedesmus sp. NREL 46B-D3]|nr:hypothetical protein COO60DRAFT_434274 [Scenedesmus sp. NREL 46B-D3]